MMFTMCLYVQYDFNIIIIIRNILTTSKTTSLGELVHNVNLESTQTVYTTFTCHKIVQQTQQLYSVQT